MTGKTASAGTELRYLSNKVVEFVAIEFNLIKKVLKKFIVIAATEIHTDNFN